MKEFLKRLCVIKQTDIKLCSLYYKASKNGKIRGIKMRKHQFPFQDQMKQNKLKQNKSTFFFLCFVLMRAGNF